ncbi:MAG TPA: XkdX family protein [Bacillus bacterium]|nr:XkdX family protein [Siminovitchia fordii]HBZ09104.1 XkdX family protein [Bacillus sp. (in: firmicutes)]
MTDFDRVKLFFVNGWATKDQVAIYVQYNKITPTQYEEITEEPYEA